MNKTSVRKASERKGTGVKNEQLIRKPTDTSEFVKYSTMEGYLEKRSTARLKTYQKRYYRVMDNGTKLCYFHNKKNPVEKPKLFPIINIIRAFPTSDKEFTIEFDTYSKQLRAKNSDEKWQWVFCLNYLVRYISFNMTVEELEKKRSQELDGDVFDIVLMENEERVLKESGKQIVEEGKVNENLPSNEKVLEYKGLKQYFDELGKDILEKYVCMGWLKKTKKKLGIRKSDDRWFILVSARPLLKGAEGESRILGAHELPISMDLETIYYYDDLEISSSEAKPLNELPNFRVRDLLIFLTSSISSSSKPVF